MKSYTYQKFYLSTWASASEVDLARVQFCFEETTQTVYANCVICKKLLYNITVFL